MPVTRLRMSARRLVATGAALLLVAAGVVLVDVQPAAAAATPVVSYSFDADSGTTVVDGSGNGNNGTWKGTPAYVAGMNGGQAIAVSGGANYVKLPLTAGQTDASSSFSYEFWMKETSRTSYGPIVSNQNFATCNNPGFSLYNQTTQGVLQGCWGQTSGGTKKYMNGGSSNLVGAWHQVAVSVDRTANLITFYVDGAQTKTSAAGDVTASTAFNSGLAFNIGGLGGSENDTGDGYTNAAIDSFSFYNAAIAASQVASDYAAAVPGASYTVAFDGNGATGGSTASEAMVSNQSKALTANGFTRPGYLFGGWATTVGGKAVYADQQTVSGLSTTAGATVTLYAVWNRLRAAGDAVAPVISLDFDGDTGSTATDSSGNGNNATWSGASSYAAGVSGSAAYVNAPAGSSGPVNFLTLPLLNGLTDGSSSFSYQFWMQETSATSDAALVSNQDFNHCYNKGVSLYNTSGSPGTLRGCFGQNGSSTAQHYLANASGGSVIGAWHHIAVVVDRTAGTLTSYVDGVQKGQQTELTSAFTLVSGNPFRIGSDGTGTNNGDGYVNAYIDDFDFFAAPISSAQIAADYAATKPAAGVPYSVAFDANHADAGTMSPEAMVSDTSKTLTKNTYTRTGYAFGGWATSAGGTPVYSDQQAVLGLSSTAGSTVTLYAVWNRYRAAGDAIAPTVSYDFDADSGATVTDSSGNALPGAWKGTPAYVPGVSGTAATVSGGANYVKLPLVAGRTDASSSFSYSFWMQEQSRTSYGPFVSNQNFVSCNNAGLTLYNQALQGVLEACWGQTPGGTRQYIHSGSDDLSGRWHYVSVVVDRTANTMAFYVDGVQTAVQDAGSITSSTVFNSGLAFNIGGLGGSETDTGDGYSTFSVDDFDFYAAAISAEQIKNDYAATKPVPTAVNDGTSIAKGFVTDTFKAPQARVGATVTQRIGALWNGPAVTSYTKVDGDDWLTVAADGTVSGTAPATAPAFPATITVEATNGTTTSRITVEVPVIAAGDAPQIATVTWNLWDSGVHVSDAMLKELAVIASNGFDVIGVQEDGGTAARALADALGWSAVEGAGGVGIVSAYPIDPASAAAVASGLPAVGATVDVLGQPIRAWSVGLDGAGYGPEAACLAGSSASPAAIVVAEKASTRYAQATAIAAAVKGDVATAGAAPVIVLGDLQSPSAGDWTAGNAAAHCNVGAVDWPVPAVFTDAGLTDSFRKASASAAGITWSPIVATTALGAPEPQDRIDYVDYAGAPLTVLGSNTFVAGWPSSTDIPDNRWTSDHRAVVTTFRLGAALPRPDVAVAHDTLVYPTGSTPSSADLLTAAGPSSTTSGATFAIDTSAVDFATPGDYSAPVTATNPADGQMSAPAAVTIRMVAAPQVTLGAPTASASIQPGETLTEAQVLALLGAGLNVPGTLTADLSKIDWTASGSYPVTVTGTDANGFTAQQLATLALSVAGSDPGAGTGSGAGAGTGSSAGGSTTGSSARGGLAATGIDPGWAIVAASILLLLGLLAVAVRLWLRRRATR
jgi:hypothetical protein